MAELNWAILGLGASVLFVYALTMWRTWCWKRTNKKPRLKGLALPEGYIRGLLAFLIVGAFIILLLFGKGPLTTEIRVTDDMAKTITITPDPSLYTAVMASLGTLAAAVVGFYFGGRVTQQAQDSANDTKESNQKPEDGVSGNGQPQRAGDGQGDADGDTTVGTGTGT